MPFVACRIQSVLGVLQVTTGKPMGLKADPVRQQANPFVQYNCDMSE
jgi:hypothetical protein